MSAAIRIDRCLDTKIVDCHVSGFDIGIHVTDSYDTSISGLSHQGIRDYAVLIERSERSYLSAIRDLDRIELDLRAINNLLDHVDAHIHEAVSTPEQVGQVRKSIDEIKAQIERGAPNQSKIKAALRSILQALRGVVIGAAGGAAGNALSDPAAAAYLIDLLRRTL